MCRMASFVVAGSFNLTPVFFFLIAQTRQNASNVPLGNTVAFTSSFLPTVHPWSIRACEDPRRASARRVEAPLA